MDQDRDRTRLGPLDPEEMKEILTAALQRSEDASERLIKLLDGLFSRKSRWETLETFSEADLNEIWSLLRRASEQSYRTDRRLHELLDDCKLLIERRHTTRPLFESRDLPDSEAAADYSMISASAPRYMVASIGPRPREFILSELRNAGDDGLPMRKLYPAFVNQFATRSVKPEGLWATTVSRMVKAGEIRQEDRDDDRWYYIRALPK